MKLSEIKEEQLTDAQRQAIIFPGFEYSGEAAETGIVLGTNTGASVRAEGGAKLFLDGKVQWLIPSGQPEWDFPEGRFSEAEYIKYLMVGEGVAPDRVLCENRATDTYENMLFSKEIIDAHPGMLTEGKLLLITSGYHMFRSLLLAQAVFPGIKIIPCPFFEEDTRAENWTLSERGRRRVESEIHFAISHARRGIMEDIEV